MTSNRGEKGGDISEDFYQSEQGITGQLWEVTEARQNECCLPPPLGSFHNVLHAENWVSYSYSCICMRYCQGKVSKLGEIKTSTLHEALLMVRVIEQLYLSNELSRNDTGELGGDPSAGRPSYSR